MRKLRSYVLMLLGASAIGGAMPSVTNAESTRLDEQRACEDALRKNTVQALEQFLRDYRYGNSTCRALALNALNNDKGGQSNRNPRRGGGGGGGFQGFTPTGYQ
ncbi:hypothetical protein [Mesorhizobium marinum]